MTTAVTLSSGPVLRPGIDKAVHIIFVPPEVEARKEVRSIEQLIDSLPNGPERAKALRRLQLLNLKLAEAGGARKGLRLPPEYYRKILSKLG